MLNIRNNKPNAIIFDWDNTLADTWPLIEKAMYDTMAEHGKAEYLEEYRSRTFGLPMKVSFPILFGDKADEMLATYVKYYHAVRHNNIKLNPFAEELIQTAHSQNIPLFIVSNKLGKSLRFEAEHINFQHYFAEIIGSGDTEFDKPHTKPVEHAIRNHNMTLDENVWFVGDSEVDMNCAMNCNCLGVLYGDSYKITDRKIPKSDKIINISCFSDLL